MMKATSDDNIAHHLGAVIMSNYRLSEEVNRLVAENKSLRDENEKMKNKNQEAE